MNLYVHGLVMTIAFNKWCGHQQEFAWWWSDWVWFAHYDRSVRNGAVHVVFLIARSQLGEVPCDCYLLCGWRWGNVPWFGDKW
jgi:hypothetical protein